jgi:hypothetical protein
MKGVFVLGMHRSGTSAAARLVNLLGVPTCVEDDLLRTTDDNPKGFWESASLAAFNDRVLEALGCDWTCPEVLGPGWEASSELDGLRSEAAAAFRRAFPTEEWIWKDPRNCLTLPFWAGALDVEPVVVLVYRNPLEVAASLGARDGFGKLWGLALWERYLRATLGSIAGRPTFVTAYDSLLSDPLGWSARAARFLEDAGVSVGPLDEAEALAFVEPALRRAVATARELDADGDLSEAQRSLLDALERLAGEHERYPEVELPPETPLTELLLAETRRTYASARALRREHEELATYAHELGQRYLELEEYARGLQERYATLEEYARGLQSRLGS